MSAAAGVRVEALVKRYPTADGGVCALDGVSLEVTPSTTLAITGPSGCGKSTLLGLVAGLEPPTTGRVIIGDEEISALPERERARVRRERLGLLFQRDNLIPVLTAVENVSLQLALLGRRPDPGRCRALLAALGLEGEADRLPDQLSGGQRQRVAMARALVHRPAVILADEPTGELDSAGSHDAVGLLLAARAESGATLIVVTHDPGVAQRMDRAVSLRDGRLAPSRTPRTREGAGALV
jgi:putative ABC transport system ATP-binding protein